MQYPNNDLWSVRQIEFLEDALKGYESKSAIYYPDKTVLLNIPDVAQYTYTGVLHFPAQDRTIIFEHGKGFGLTQEVILDFLQQKDVQVTLA